MNWNGKKIRQLRGSLGMDRQQFAELVRVSVITVRYWETDRIEPPGPVTYVLDDLQERLTEGRPIPQLQSA